MKIINNINEILKDDLQSELKKGSQLSIAAAYFSIYAFQELKKELTNLNEFRFIFTAPTFTTEKVHKEKREFYIPRLTRERSLYGTEFEIKLRNKLTQKAIAKECADWIKEKAHFKSNISGDVMQPFINANDKIYTPVNGFTTVDLGCERGNNAYSYIIKNEYPESEGLIKIFNEYWNSKSRVQDVTDEVLESISSAYNENSPDYIYFMTLYNIFNEFLEDISEDVLPNEATGFKESNIWNMLYNFQRDAALAIINKLEKYNGCILADSVGLGKTFTALAVIKYYENRGRTVLVLCPKKLANNWSTYKHNYINNPLLGDRLRYDILYHTDLNRTSGKSGELDLDRISWSNYDLVVIDESHNFRNGGKIDSDIDNSKDEKQNRYALLMNKVIRKGVKTKVLMLSATPVNNRFNDLKNQLALAYEGKSEYIDNKLNTTRSIDEIFRNAQRSFNTWSKWDINERTTENLLRMLDFDFFEVLDSVTIARSRKHIQKYYNTSEIGTFPIRNKPISKRPLLTDLPKAINYNEIIEQIIQLNLHIYMPSHYIQKSCIDKYQELFGDDAHLTQQGREQGIRRLMAINLMKRMESSVHSFNLTLTRIKEQINDTIEKLDAYKKSSREILDLVDISNIDDLDADDQNNDELFAVGKKVKIDLADMDRESWRYSLVKDKETLELLTLMVSDITPQHDSKLQELFAVIKNKIEHPINGDNKKLIIFTAFADTADYLYENVSKFVKQEFNLETALITGTVDGKTTIPKLKADLNSILTCFSPISKDRDMFNSFPKYDIDILIATDCISEGQNLQDCDYLINYDIHWNPVRIIQRFGRIDRIGSQNERIQLVNFWPSVTLDEYIDLKARVETRMKIVDIAATGDDNLLSDNEQADLEYRKNQLKRLQDEVVDIEDMSTGISIMDLGLNEFRLDLLDYIKEHPEIEKAPFGMHSVVAADENNPAGVIYVLKNRSDTVNIDKQNRLHPFYMVYVDDEGEVICDHLSPKAMLDRMRYLCKGKDKPIAELYRSFNQETDDGKNMAHFSDLLSEAIHSIIEVKAESDMTAFLDGEAISFVANEIKGLDDFELICFLVVK